MRNKRYLLTIIIFLLVIPACSISFGNTEFGEADTHESLPAESDSGPDAQVEEESMQDEPDVSYNGINLSSEIGDSLNGSTVPGDPAGEPFWSMPEHDEIAIRGYPIGNDYHEPVVYVFSAENYRTQNEAAASVMDELAGLLASRPADPAVPLPLLPIFNAGQMGTAKMKFIDFNNGSGVRYITQLGQALWPFNNSGMFYTFQGMTTDGRFFVSMIMPLSLPALAQYDDFQPEDDFYETAEQLIDNQIVILENASEDQFTPTLNDLDAMAGSLSIEK